MSKVSVGDRVRVVLEGDVSMVERKPRPGYFEMGADVQVDPRDPHVVSVEVLPRPLKVGDFIEGASAYEALPVGSVVGEPGGDAWFRTPTTWTSSRGYGEPSLWCERVIAYLPPESA